MRKSKLLLGVVSGLCLLVSLLACQSASQTTPSETSAPDTPAVTLTTTTSITTSEVVQTEMFLFEGEYAPVLPKADEPQKLYIAQTPDSTNDLLTLVSLQGIMARNTDERILIHYDESDTLFLNTIKSLYPDCSVGYLTSLWSFIQKNPTYVSGYILTDLRDDSINIATSLAGILNAVIVNRQNESKAKSAGLTCLLDVSDKDDAWLRSSEYWERLNRDVAFMHNPGNIENLRDYAILCDAYVFTDALSTQEEIMTCVEHMNDGFLILGWNTACGELNTVRALSKRNGSIIAADFAKNLSTLSSFPLYQAHQKTEESDTSSKHHHTVTVVISDGDNLQWALNTLPVSSYWFRNAARGQYALGWGLPASLLDVASPVLEYYYRTMKSNEEFIMQLSGLGYTFPSLWRNRTALAEMQRKMGELMARADMSVMEILDDARLNETVVKTYYGGFLEQESIDGILYIDYSDYSSYNGEVYWVNGKPFVTARYRIWADFTDIDSLAASINAAPTNPKSAQSYSFIIVHAWSGLDENGNVVENGNTLDAVTALINKLDDNVEVVTPSEFIRRLTENVSPQ